MKRKPRVQWTNTGANSNSTRLHQKYGHQMRLPNNLVNNNPNKVPVFYGQQAKTIEKGSLLLVEKSHYEIRDESGVTYIHTNKGSTYSQQDIVLLCIGDIRLTEWSVSGEREISVVRTQVLYNGKKCVLTGENYSQFIV